MGSLAQAVVVGLACYFTVSVVRALPPFRGWVQRQLKPWACDLCMSFWSAVAWNTGLTIYWRAELSPSMWAAAGGACLALLKLLSNEIPEPPPGLVLGDDGAGRPNGKAEGDQGEFLRANGSPPGSL